MPTIKGAFELQQRNPKKALKELEIAKSYERAAEFYPQYIRGLSYLELKENGEAKREFQKILDHRGDSPLSSLYPLARLGKARATKDKREYEKFFELWKDADEDMPALVEAKKEYEKLK